MKFVCVILMILMLSSCGLSGEKNGVTASDVPKTGDESAGVQAEALPQQEIDGIRSFSIKLLSSIIDIDAEVFRDLISDDGFISVTYLVDGRSRNVVTCVTKETLRKDLVLVGTDDMAGMNVDSLSSYYRGEELPVRTSPELGEISFGVQWSHENLDDIRDKLGDIIGTCIEINKHHNERVIQIFVLKDNVYALASSSGVSDPDDYFTGGWAIFEKTGEGYRLKAMIQMQ